MKNILEYWPISSPPRPSQIQALNWLVETQDKKYQILEMPVGGGKSLVGITYSRYLDAGQGNSFILTPQRILQEQYEESFDKKMLLPLYGKSNYKCSNCNSSCAIGSLMSTKCDSCPHVIAKLKAQKIPNVVLNYHLALSSFSYTETFDPRQLMVMDECHNLEQLLTEFDSVSVLEGQCKRYGIKFKYHSNINKAYNWVEDFYMPKLIDYRLDLEDQCEAIKDQHAKPSKRELKTLEEFKQVDEHMMMLEEFLDAGEDVSKEYVLVHDKTSFKFKRLQAGNAFNVILKPKADKFLFMSSTIHNYEGFCRDNGIALDDAAFLSLDSEFPDETRPVFYMPQMKMNAKWHDDDNSRNRIRYLDTLVNILELHKPDKGIIHTGNFAIAEWLVDNLQGATPHYIFHHNPESGDDRNSVINAFQNAKKPSILISPSITEGLDLYDDRARFAIVAKIPFGFLGDQWIRARLDQSQEWYQRQAIIQVIQESGRIVRSKDDWGNVYILDESFGYLFQQTKHNVPQWWKDAYRV